MARPGPDRHRHATGHARRRWISAALCLVLAAGFMWLGQWQVARRAWKIDLIARVQARIHAPPGPLPPRGAWRGDLAYRRVRLAGTFRHDRETLVQAVTDLGPGWWVVTPLATADATVLVNRGFVPAERASPASRTAGEVGGRVTVTGLIRASEPGGGFLRANDPATGRWYSRDVAAIARARGLADTAPFFVDADAAPNPGGLPVGGLTVVAFRNAHLVYALTWFALAALSLAGAVLFAGWRVRRRPSA